MIRLAYAWVLVLLVLPILVRKLSQPYQVQRPSVRVPFLDRLATQTGREPGDGAVVMRHSPMQLLALAVIWILLVLGMARPQRLEEPVTRTIPTRDLLVAVDLSGSMEAEDFTDAEGNTISRVEAVKQVMDEFLARREGDRVGLIFFGTGPFVQVPFTEDLEVCRLLLQEAQPKMCGPKTMLGDAIGRGIAVFEESDLEEKVLILLTDGNDSGSQVPPLEAAGIARDKGIQIHTIGMGDPATLGEEKLDVDTLKAIAETTGGNHFLAIDRAQLNEVYNELDKLITRKVDTLTDRPVTELYWWFLGGALLVAVFYPAAAIGRQLFREGSRDSEGVAT
jgi:Ca-activated chloride channel family protein